MKNIINVCSIFSLLLCFSCQAPEKPTLKDVRNIRVLSISNDLVTIQADAIIENPNMVELSITDVAIEVKVNDVSASEVSQVEDTKIPANSERSVPLKVSFPPSKVMKSTGLGGLLNMALSKSVKVNYKGSLNVSVMGISFDVPIDEEKQVSLKSK
ncbi:MAG: LEA14-like dessication related protein [Flammeovirgaceae bacterium]|jgi:LEA14-like dessication related protein